MVPRVIVGMVVKLSSYRMHKLDNGCLNGIIYTEKATGGVCRNHERGHDGRVRDEQNDPVVVLFASV